MTIFYGLLIFFGACFAWNFTCEMISEILTSAENKAKQKERYANKIQE